MDDVIFAFAAGCAVTAVVLIFFGVLSRRNAERKGFARARSTMPLLGAQMEAERDLHRIEFAHQTTKIERQSDQLREKLLEAEALRHESEEAMRAMKVEFLSQSKQLAEAEQALENAYQNLAALQAQDAAHQESDRQHKAKQFELESKMESRLQARDEALHASQSENDNLRKKLRAQAGDLARLSETEQAMKQQQNDFEQVLRAIQSAGLGLDIDETQGPQDENGTVFLKIVKRKEE